MPFTMEQNSQRCLEISMTKIFQDLDGKTGNLMGNFKEDLNKCKYVPRTWTGKHNM